MAGRAVTQPRGTETYRALLERLDAWAAAARERHAGVVPCRAGCTACCHGPFDITIADAELVAEAIGRMPAPEREEVAGRAAALLGRMHALAPDWRPPHEVAALGEERFDGLSDALAGEPCPLLGAEGRCRVYESRPMVCRLIGLPMRSPAGRTIENACPIQERHPAYAALPAQAFDLEEFERAELECLAAAAERVLGDAVRWGFETTVAAVAADPGAYRGRRASPA